MLINCATSEYVVKPIVFATFCTYQNELSWPKMGYIWLEMAQGGSKMGLDGPQMGQDGIKMGFTWSEIAQDRPKMS